MSISASPSTKSAETGGDPGYTALRSGAVWFVVTDEQRFVLSGEERIGFLNSYNTQDIKNLPTYHATQGAFLTQKGKLVSEARVLSFPDRILLLFPAGFGDKVAQHLGTFLMFAKVVLEDATGRWAHFAVLGPQGESALRQIWPDLPPLAENRIVELAWEGTSTYLFASSRFGAAGWEILIPAAQGPEFQSRLQGLQELPLLAMNETLRETARIEAGIPKMGVDMGEDNLVAEVGLDVAATSFNKGCYLGQETTARVQSRGHVNRKLTPVRLAQAVAEDLPVDIFQGEKKVGVLTSAAESPKFGGWIGLATVALNAWENAEEKFALTKLGRISIQKL